MIAALFVLVVVIVVLSLMTILILTDLVHEKAEADRSLPEVELRSPERQLHDMARHSFELVLTEARSHDRPL